MLVWHFSWTECLVLIIPMIYYDSLVYIEFSGQTLNSKNYTKTSGWGLLEFILDTVNTWPADIDGKVTDNNGNEHKFCVVLGHSALCDKNGSRKESKRLKQFHIMSLIIFLVLFRKKHCWWKITLTGLFSNFLYKYSKHLFYHPRKILISSQVPPVENLIPILSENKFHVTNLNLFILIFRKYYKSLRAWIKRNLENMGMSIHKVCNNFLKLICHIFILSSLTWMMKLMSIVTCCVQFEPYSYKLDEILIIVS